MYLTDPGVRAVNGGCLVQGTGVALLKRLVLWSHRVYPCDNIHAPGGMVLLTVS